MSTNLDYFYNTAEQQDEFFDEGPAVIVRPIISGTNTVGLDTSAIDGYRQGVEITRLKYYDAGLAKIHAGEPGHVLRKNTFGMDQNFPRTAVYQDLDYFNPVVWVRAQGDAVLGLSIFTYPIVISSDNDQLESYNFNGVLEPFTIRARASFSSIDVPFEPHEFKASLMAGNEDTTFASDEVLTVDYYDVTRHQSGFIDEVVDMFEGMVPLKVGYFNNVKAPQAPWCDTRLLRNANPPTSSYDYSSDMIEAISAMQPDSDNYISNGKRSATSGWVYGQTTGVGTDSLAFGGMTY